jgi:cysteinyl-tRNA synthetase
MPFRLYNTRTRAVEPFVPLDSSNVRIYVCGLTPSAEAHLGHARSFMFFDVLRRYLVHLGYRVTYVQNVTDIDDRSIAAAKATGVVWTEIVEGYLASFKGSMNRLHVLEPDHEPRATRYVPEITLMIERLIATEHAYVAPDGVYYSVSSFPRYGALSGRNTDELLIGARIAPDEGKRDPLDFALWKFVKPGEPSWPSPWGDGRPGWHIECSAMSHALLGEPFDIHGGGFDLIFPHHENEIAQTEALEPSPMANVWMHGGLLQFDGRKMSKSLGNFEPLATLLDRHDPQAIRLLFLQAGYRKPLNFTEASIEGNTTALRRLQAAYDLLRTARGPSVERAASDPAVVEAFERRFYAALDDDMNTAGAVSVLFDLAGQAPKIVSSGGASLAAAFFHTALTLVGLSPNERAHHAASESRQVSKVIGAPVDPGVPAGARGGLSITGPERGDQLLGPGTTSRLAELLSERLSFNGETSSEAVERVIEERYRAKQRKEFAYADELRRALRDVGVELKDAKEGVTWSVAG